MTYRISYFERAIREYEEATTWYRERSELAAENFQIAVQEKIEYLKLAPQQFKRTYRFYHEVSLRKYPYCIVYMIDEAKKNVIISSIFHHKRNPNKKYK